MPPRQRKKSTQQRKFKPSSMRLLNSSNQLTISDELRAAILSAEIHCYHCGSPNFVARGKTRNGKLSEYKCLDCHRIFTPCGRSHELLKRQITKPFECPYCLSIAYSNRGFSREGKQRFRCTNCRRHFTEGSKKNAYLYLSDDVWDMEKELGVKTLAHRSDVKLVFSNIKQDWLKELVKKYIRFKAVNCTASTLIGRVSSLNQFSYFLLSEFPGATLDSFNRDLIIHYLAYIGAKNISASTHRQLLGALKDFLEIGVVNGWFYVTPYLIRTEDFRSSKKKSTPRYIPKEVLEQLNQHLSELPEQIERMILVLQTCGLRISELCLLKLDCLRQDNQGDWFLHFTRNKTKQESLIPLPLETVRVIQKQQQYILENLGSDFEYLFCARQKGSCSHGGEFKPKRAVISYASFQRALKQLAEKHNIVDSFGNPWEFQSHQFRHTVATSMVNAGVPLNIIQKYLGHTSPEMTLTYAELFDSTLKKEVFKYHNTKVVKITGEVVSSENPELDNDKDLQWMKKKIMAQALPNGSCARPVVQGTCPHANACLTCGDFRTTIEYLDQHIFQLEQTQKIIEKAKANGWQRQVEMNDQIKTNLENIIKSLETKDE